MSLRVKVVDAHFFAGSTSVEGLPEATLEEVAFVGRSNVGKSSLINTMVERHKLVRTSNTPGCTRQINVFAVRLADARELYLVDLPGYGYAKLSKTEREAWGDALERYVRMRSALRGVVLIVDARRGFEADDAQMAEFLRAPRPGGPPPRLVIVATKLDKLEKAGRKLAIARVSEAARAPVVGFSARTGEGRESLWSHLLARGTSP